ncbi:hypothetical protein WISP_76348 [Willisornis vidua]|uniref:Uncharacterized protein n=1 Tax=Willisornis vidua TaxID=1566151 RepID=A0ABQ9D600_9PASS|nr:hypothetical protein WISP_76348 [Willisornis vidua]
MVKTMVRQDVFLQLMNIHGRMEVHLKHVEVTTPEQGLLLLGDITLNMSNTGVPHPPVQFDIIFHRTIEWPGLEAT